MIRRFHAVTMPVTDDGLDGHISISRGNSKLGKVLNVSFPPGVGCVKAGCYKDCYARKAYRLYPSVVMAWGDNYRIWYRCQASNSTAFWEAIRKAIGNEKPKFFRWFVGGDIPNQCFLGYMELIAENFPKVKFLCFTKHYEYDYAQVPQNLKVILSTWPRYRLPNRRGIKELMSWAWIESDKKRLAASGRQAVHCKGQCDACNYRCWDTKKDVVFKRH
jgi:hypothetical protein